MIVLTHDGTIINTAHVSCLRVETNAHGSYVAAWEAGTDSNPWQLTPYITDRYAEFLLHLLFRHWRDGHAALSFESIKVGSDIPEDDGV